MAEELTTEQKALMEQMFIDPATFNVSWAHTPFNVYWRTNNFVQRSLSYLFALDTTQDPDKWIPLEVDAQGRLEVASIAAGIIGNMYAWDGTGWQRVTCDGTGDLQVDIKGALPAGTAAIGKLAANSGVDIGDVDVLSLPAITAAANNILVYGYDGTANQKVATFTDGTLKIYSIAQALPAGTNAIGKLAANSGVDIGDVDVLSLPSLPSGTNAIGKLAANSGVDIGDVDVTSTVQPTGFSTIADGRKTIAAAGTAETLVAASTPAKEVAITAETDNTGIIVVGGSSVVATLAARRGIPINAGDTISFPIADLISVYLDTTVNGDGVTFTYLS